MKKIVQGMAAALGVCLASASFGQTTFGYTGGSQTYTVPAGVTSIRIKVWGAGGGDNQAYDAAGNFMFGAMGAAAGFNNSTLQAAAAIYVSATAGPQNFSMISANEIEAGILAQQSQSVIWVVPVTKG